MSAPRGVTGARSAPASSSALTTRVPPRVRWPAFLSAVLSSLALLLLAACGPEAGTAHETASGERTAAGEHRAGSAGGAAAGAAAEYGIVIHGGAGTIRRQDVTRDREAEYHAALEAALRAGYEVLSGGGSALDAVSEAVVLLEDSPLFNAGKGSVFTAEGTNELDAAIMDGRTRNAGAVAGLTRTRNPIRLARLVMEESPHVFLVGEGAESYGREHGIEEVDPDYFHTEDRWEALQRALRAEGPTSLGTPPEVTLGTVGAVALDRDGNLAAATSTGGMTAKRFGRVGDVPVIGAGTYADNESCAVSGTGHGEFFIRNVVTHDICARMRYGGASLEQAAEDVVMGVLVEQGASGGIVAIDREGRIALVFNTPGMYRGHMLAGREPVTGLYRDD